MSTNGLYAASKNYTDKGLNVIPLVHGQKLPLAGFDLSRSFTIKTSEAELKSYFGNGVRHNIGVVTGSISQLIVIDIDGEKTNSTFLQCIDQLPSIKNKIANTLGATSGKGLHFYLRIPSVEFPLGIETTTLLNGQDGEIRVKGNRGYVVAPPSLHPNGKIYRSNDKELQSINMEEWRQLLSAFGTSEQTRRPIHDLFAPQYKIAAGNNRHEDLLRVMESLIARNHEFLSEIEIRKWAHDWNRQHCGPPLSDEEFERQWRDAKKFIAKKTEERHEHQSGIPSLKRGDSTEGGKKEEVLENGKGQNKRDAILGLVKEGCEELFSDQYQRPFACFKVNNHRETLPIGSINFRLWVAHAYYSKTKSALSSDDIATVVNTLKGAALFEGCARDLHLRVANHPTHADTIFYDLCDPQRNCVKLTKSGWRIEPAPILFVRYNNQSPQVMPACEYDADIMNKFLALTNLKGPEERLLVKVLMTTLFIPGISKAILDTHGEQGSAKTFLQRILKSVVDPSRAEMLTIPKRPDELLLQLNHNYVTVYNNLSKLDDWASDIFCKAIEGTGASKRMLYTDDDEIIFNFRHCILINGINTVAHNADLVDRTISVHLERIPKEKRRKESELLAEIENIKPQLLGHIFDIIVKVLNQKGNVSLAEYPRLADFAEYGELVARCMGHKPGEFIQAYFNNIKLQTQDVLESSSVAQAIVELMKDRTQWGPGRYAELLQVLKDKATELKIDFKSRGVFPSRPSSLGQQLNKLKTTLREFNITIEVNTDPKTNTRLVTIRKDGEKSSGSSGHLPHDSGGTIFPEDSSAGQPAVTLDGLFRINESPPAIRDEEPEDLDDFSGSPKDDLQARKTYPLPMMDSGRTYSCLCNAKVLARDVMAS